MTQLIKILIHTICCASIISTISAFNLNYGLSSSSSKARISSGRVLLGASLRPMSGGDDIIIPEGGEIADLGYGCAVEKKEGRYYCTVSDSEGTTFIGSNDLTPGVRYLLSNGMKIKTASEEEFDVVIDESGVDPTMKMMFEAMKAGFPSDIEST